MTNQLITNRLPIDYSLISLMSLMSSISYAWYTVPRAKQEGLALGQLQIKYGREVLLVVKVFMKNVYLSLQIKCRT